LFVLCERDGHSPMMAGECFSCGFDSATTSTQLTLRSGHRLKFTLSHGHVSII